MADRLKNTLKNLPAEPGVYKMLDEAGSVIYIGKAKLLDRRVRSYFNKNHLDLKTLALVALIREVDIIVTRSEEDALILERQLVRHFQPKYNILLKDDKNFPFIKITTEAFPKILITRNRENDKATYFGPYSSIGSTQYLKRMLYDLFPLRDCSQNIDLVHQQPKCLQLDLGRCIGPCIYKDIKPNYDQIVHQLKLLLSGRNQKLVSELRREMYLLAEGRAYEKAAAIRDKISKIEKLTQRQTVGLPDEKSVHILGLAQNSDYFYLIIQKIVDGKLLYQNGFYTSHDQTPNALNFVEQSLLTLYEDPTERPEEIIADQNLSSLTLPFSVNFSFPKLGTKKNLLDLAIRNASFALQRLMQEKFDIKRRDTDAVLRLKEVLNLATAPTKILGFDISHHAGQNIVASAVFFQNGKPLKQRYRKYQIRSVTTGQSNDFESMYEVVLRRLSAAIEKREPMPNLILIDGGAQQLAFARSALASLPLPEPIPSIGLAKKREEIYLEPELPPLTLPDNDAARHLLMRIRDESHRFALAFQRQKRRQSTLVSRLDSIPGLGQKRIQLIYQNFKTLDRVKQTPAAELAKVGKFSLKLAEQILAVLKTQ